MTDRVLSTVELASQDALGERVPFGRREDQHGAFGSRRAAHHGVHDAIGVFNERNRDVLTVLAAVVIPLPLSSRQVEFGPNCGLSS